MLTGAARRRTSASITFFTHILAHELSHGIGPHQIQVAGRDTTPRQELKELYSAIEEAKADVTGLFMLQYLFDHGTGGRAASDERQLYTTYPGVGVPLAAFRLDRGARQGHGDAVQLSVRIRAHSWPTPDGTFAVNYAKMKAAVRDLTHDLLTLEAKGDYAGCEADAGHAGGDPACDAARAG